MRRHNRLAIAVALVFCVARASTAPAAPEGRGSEPPRSRQESVSRRVRITWDPATLTLDTKRIVHLLEQPTESPLLREEIRKYAGDGRRPRSVRFERMLEAAGGAELGLLLGEYTLSFAVTDKDKPVIQLLEGLMRQVGDMLKAAVSVRDERLRAQVEAADEDRSVARGRADRVWRELAEIRRRVVRGEGLQRKLDAHRASIAEFEQQLRQLGVEEDAKAARLTAVRSQMAEIAAGAAAKAGAGSSVAELKRRITETKKKLEAARRTKRDQHPDVAALKSALASLEASLAQATTHPVRAAGDPVAAELGRLVEAREKVLALTIAREKRGQQSASERLQAEAALAEAKVQFARRRFQLSRSGQASELLVKLKHEQVALMIDLGEMDARRDGLRKLLDQTEVAARALSERVGEVTDLTMRLEQIKALKLAQPARECQQANVRYEALKRQVRVLTNAAPRAIVLAPKKPKK